MGDYDLSGLSSRSFEKLIQALAVKNLGAGTVVFGDGPDGGREASFEGRMDYPSEADPWEGYCVIQAKFRSRPEGTLKDGKWALDQLEEELKKFADRKKGRLLPEYYVFATNVVLSAVQDKGAKDKIAGLFRKYKRKVPVQDWAVWDFDQIGTFLDNAGEIRRAYAAWITPGDVLSAVVKHLQAERPDFLEVMTSFLARDLLRDQYANLEQAGHMTKDKIPLARVFVDLPTTTERAAEPPKEDDEGESKVAELVGRMVEAARDPLNPTTTKQLEDRADVQESLWRAAVGPQPGRYVLVGGPGQGKTTVGQFVCQLFRAALLLDRPLQLLSREARDALLDVRQHCGAEGLQLPRARRFPARIVLSEFAKALNDDPELSLLEYLAGLIRRRTGRNVSTEDLRTWLGAYPWLLVLDGLDEVPASTNRDEVLRRVDELWIDAAQCEADLLVVATTRPQGYNDDFSPKHYRHLWLAPLSVNRALDYARRLAEVRYAEDEERQKKILGRLQQAAGDDATARLMRSPLQITILATLVDHIGPPPQDRWQLFYDYYDVIYRRERERDIPAAAILRDHRPNIDAIHHQVGLWLQLEAERAGGTEARLSAERFEKIVAARLEKEGYDEEELGKLRMAIIEAAANRLVFLVGLESDQVGFEIRSLQEFMAAQELMSGSDSDVRNRLRRIAPISSWRNAFLFAAGRCFSQADKEHFRDNIFTLCSSLNDKETGEVEEAIMAGSQLALELLEDGIARKQPKYARLLADCACRLLSQPPAAIHARLGELAGGPAENVLFEQLEGWLSRGVPSSLGAWTTLFPLMGQGLSAALELARRYWPEAPGQQLGALQVPTAEYSLDWLAQRIEGAVRANHPRDFWSLHYTRLLRRVTDVDPSKEPLFWVFTRYKQPDFPERILECSFAQELTIRITSLGKAQKRLPVWKGDAQEAHPGWLPVVAGYRFTIKPSKRRLVETLKTIAASPASFPLWLPPRVLPWVLGVCLAEAEVPDEVAFLADRAAAGELGDEADWRAAEERWRKRNITLDEILYMTDDHWPFDRSVATRGVVLSSLGISGGDSFLKIYLDSIDPLKGADKLKNRLAWGALTQVKSIAGEDQPAPWLTPAAFQRIWGRTGGYITGEVCAQIAHWARQDVQWLAVLDSVGRTASLHSGISRGRPLELFASLFEAHPDKFGLLPILAETLAREGNPRAVVLPPVCYEDFEDPHIRRAALLLELARGGMRASRAVELAAVTAEMAELDEMVVGKAVRLLGRSEVFDEPSERYLFELHRQLQGDRWGGRRILLTAMEDSFGRRSSGLANPGTWRFLALPEGLLDAIA